MKSLTSFNLAAVVISLFLFVTNASAESAQGYTWVEYDEQSGILTAYAETLTGDLSYDYQAEVTLTVKDQTGAQVGYGSMLDTANQHASVLLYINVQPGNTYTATGVHRVRLSYWDYAPTFPYNPFWYDDWFMSHFGPQNIEQPLGYYFGSPGYYEYRRTSDIVPLGRTYDSVTTPAAPTVTNVTSDAGTKKITSVVGDQNILHFVTPKGTGDITLTATLSSNTQQVLNNISWEGATESSSNPRVATLSRGTASKVVVKIKHNQTVLKELRVWIVWVSLTGTVAAPSAVATVNGSNKRDGTTISAAFASEGTIQPSSLISDANRPNLSGSNTTEPPPQGATNVAGDPLSGGATKKWDVSRRIKIRASTQSPPFDPEVIVDRNDNFPTNSVTGNDDAGVSDEVNDPYSNNGKVSSTDEPRRSFRIQGGNVGDTYRSQLWFQEFVRLELAGTWYVVSDPRLWRVDIKMKKKVITETLWDLDYNSDGDQSDNITETMYGIDANGDGDMNDELGYWDNDSSASANDNAGA